MVLNGVVTTDPIGPKLPFRRPLVKQSIHWVLKGVSSTLSLFRNSLASNVFVRLFQQVPFLRLLWFYPCVCSRHTCIPNETHPVYSTPCLLSIDILNTNRSSYKPCVLDTNCCTCRLPRLQVFLQVFFSFVGFLQ